MDLTALAPFAATGLKISYDLLKDTNIGKVIKEKATGVVTFFKDLFKSNEKALKAINDLAENDTEEQTKKVSKWIDVELDEETTKQKELEELIKELQDLVNKAPNIDKTKKDNYATAFNNSVIVQDVSNNSTVTVNYNSPKSEDKKD